MMQSIELSQFEQLLEATPNPHIYHFCEESEEINSLLQNFVDRLEGKLVKKTLKDFDEKKFTLKQREFEYAIISNVLPHIQDKMKFLDTIYHSLENSANIIIVEKTEKCNPLEIAHILTEVDFRAVNSIDTIIQDAIVFTGKKMHMWGNGL